MSNYNLFSPAEHESTGIAAILETKNGVIEILYADLDLHINCFGQFILDHPLKENP